MRKDIRELAVFIEDTIENNAKFGMVTLLTISCNFGFGTMSLVVDPDCITFGSDFFFVNSSNRDCSDCELEIDLTDEMEIVINNDGKTFDIINKGVTGFLD